jgi:hypothetical protein
MAEAQLGDPERVRSYLQHLCLMEHADALTYGGRNAKLNGAI